MYIAELDFARFAKDLLKDFYYLDFSQYMSTNLQSQVNTSGSSQ